MGLKRKIDNFISKIFFGETLDESDARARMNFTRELISVYKNRCGEYELPFDTKKLSIKGIIDCKGLFGADYTDVDRIVHDINYGVFETIINHFQENEDFGGPYRYYKITNKEKTK